MQKIKVSELFGPVGYWRYEASPEGMSSVFTERYGVTQGEGKYVGQRSVFLRTFGCNLTCPSFGLDHGEVTDEPDQISKQVNLYKSVADLPAAQYGCDSYYSWHVGFKHLSPMLDVEELAKQILACAGGSFFTNRASPVHLILTGGEPLLGWQRAYVELVEQLRIHDPIWSKQTWLRLPVTFETNGTQPLLKNKQGNLAGVPFIHTMAASCNITWSVSAKLTVSGHSNEEAIAPEVVASYLNASKDMYLKYVVQSVSDFEEVDRVTKQFRDAGVDVPVYIMAEGGDPSEYQKHNTLDLVAESVKRGYNITPRLHVMIGGNVMSW